MIYCQKSKSSLDSFRDDFCIKESLGEYGSGWGWDGNTHAISQSLVLGYPLKYSVFDSKIAPVIVNSGDRTSYVSYGQVSSSYGAGILCDTEITIGSILVSQSIMINQLSCMPSAHNAGIFYKNPKVTSSGNNTMCSTGWTIPYYDGIKSYLSLMHVYNIGSNKESHRALNSLPISLLQVGFFDMRTSGGTFTNRNDYSFYHILDGSFRFDAGGNVYNAGGTGWGHSLRCVRKSNN